MKYIIFAMTFFAASSVQSMNDNPIPLLTAKALSSYQKFIAQESTLSFYKAHLHLFKIQQKPLFDISKSIETIYAEAILLNELLTILHSCTHNENVFSLNIRTQAYRYSIQALYNYVQSYPYTKSLCFQEEDAPELTMLIKASLLNLKLLTMQQVKQKELLQKISTESCSNSSDNSAQIFD